ncbi:MAG: hypothetical protein K1X75_04540 [Leptospirales bacterium]|nr:hypothetical protein [Leptospirales bacterium]
MASSSLQAKPYYDSGPSPLTESIDHSPPPLQALLAESDRNLNLEQLRSRPIGRYYPTYYNLADENYFPPGNTVALDLQGRALLRTSPEFLREVNRQGSGITRDGLRLRYAGRSMRFAFYPRNIWGYGAGGGYQVFPYRTIAIDFGFVCRAAGMAAGCRSASIIGALVRIAEISERRPAMPGGTRHDGYFCAADTGAPASIRNDRIDIFVGLHGGGNPYLPEYRRGNALLAGGFENLNPWDWRLWRTPTERVWCPLHHLPRDPEHPRAGECSHDYHTQARHKALNLRVFFRPDGSLLRCRASGRQ